MRRSSRAAALLAVLCVPAQSSPRPRNPRRRPAPVVAVSTATTADRLASARWDPQVAASLELTAQVDGATSSGYDSAVPPVIALPLQGTLADGDAGLVVFLKLVRQAEFKFSDEFWNVVPIPYGRQRIRAAYEQFSGLPRDSWNHQPAYRQYVKGFVSSYQDMCLKVGRKECRMYLAQLWIGFTEPEARDYARRALAEEQGQRPRLERVGESDDDPRPVVVRRGWSAVSEAVDLARLFSRAGFQVWVADLDRQGVLESALAELGLAQAHAAGILGLASKDRLTAAISDPVPFRSGKIDAVVSATGRTPAVVVGVSRDDLELMNYGKGLRVLFDRGDAELRRQAVSRHWPIQPAEGW